MGIKHCHAYKDPTAGDGLQLMHCGEHVMQTSGAAADAHQNFRATYLCNPTCPKQHLLAAALLPVSQHWLDHLRGMAGPV